MYSQEGPEDHCPSDTSDEEKLTPHSPVEEPSSSRRSRRKARRAWRDMGFPRKFEEVFEETWSPCMYSVVDDGDSDSDTDDAFS